MKMVGLARLSTLISMVCRVLWKYSLPWL
jgi:hypothetical protein